MWLLYDIIETHDAKVSSAGMFQLTKERAVSFVIKDIEVLHGGHVACQEQYNIIPMGQNVHSNAKHFYYN